MIIVILSDYIGDVGERARFKNVHVLRMEGNLPKHHSFKVGDKTYVQSGREPEMVNLEDYALFYVEQHVVDVTDKVVPWVSGMCLGCGHVHNDESTH